MSGRARSYLITGLRPATRYTIHVVPVVQGDSAHGPGGKRREMSKE